MSPWDTLMRVGFGFSVTLAAVEQEYIYLGIWLLAWGLGTTIRFTERKQ